MRRSGSCARKDTAFQALLVSTDVAAGERAAREAERVGRYGGYQAIGVDLINRVYTGASESRKDGQAAGY